MELKIEVDESKFHDILEKELNALTKEEISSVIKDGIAEALRANNYELVRTVFFEVTWSNTVLKPSKFFEDIIKQLDYSDLQDILDNMVDDLKENHERILKTVLIESICTGLMDTYAMRQSVENTIRGLLRRQ